MTPQEYATIVVNFYKRNYSAAGFESVYAAVVSFYRFIANQIMRDELDIVYYGSVCSEVTRQYLKLTD